MWTPPVDHQSLAASARISFRLRRSAPHGRNDIPDALQRRDNPQNMVTDILRLRSERGGSVAENPHLHAHIRRGACSAIIIVFGKVNRISARD
jgi:hypothetical protein